jgi:hypothetical protein
MALSLALFALVFAALGTDNAAARPCVVSGRVILGREHVSCAPATHVAGVFFSTLRAPSGWRCYGSRGTTWRGYCESRRAYFRWRPV